MKKTLISLLAIIIVLMSVNYVSAIDYYYSPMNFYSQTNHSFEVNIAGSINVTLPNNFSLVSGSLTGNNNISFVMQSPVVNSSEPQLFIGSIYVDNVKYDDYYLLFVQDEKIVDNKVEIGHGDFNYIDGNAMIGDDRTMLFNIVRVWAMGSDILNEPANDIYFNCTYPLIIPNTVDSKYTTTYSSNDILAEGRLSRMEGISMFRVFVLSQEIDYNVNDNYEVSCGNIYYNYTHTNVVANVPDFNLSIRSTQPLIINMANNSEYVTYTIINNEQYDLRNLEFLWTLGTNTLRAELNSLDSGAFVQYNVPTNSSGTINLKARFVPQWMFNSRSPVFYEQSEFNYYYTPSILSGLNSSLYYDNQIILSPAILETQTMSFGIDILQNSPFGGSYKITYKFYDDGVLQDEVERQVIGIQTHTISFSSLELEPSGLEEDYEVYTIVSIRDDNGDWHDFDEEFIGIQTIAALTSNAPRIGYYDVIVINEYERYESDDRITADIVITNTGDTPDEDTILTYYLLGPNGEKFGETKEQILEVPVGTTTLTRSITLPLGADIGEWQFYVEYETIVQPRIDVYDSFQVVTGMSVLERARIDGNLNWAIVWLFIFILFIALVNIGVRRKRKIKKR